MQVRAAYLPFPVSLLVRLPQAGCVPRPGVTISVKRVDYTTMSFWVLLANPSSSPLDL